MNGGQNNTGRYIHLDRLLQKKNKSKSKLIELLDNGYEVCICVITEYEVYSGATSDQVDYWKNFLKKIIVLPLDQHAIKIAVGINNQLKAKSKQIALADLFIASITLSNNLSIATLNKKYFERISQLELIEV